MVQEAVVVDSRIVQEVINLVHLALEVHMFGQVVHPVDWWCTLSI